MRRFLLRRWFLLALLLVIGAGLACPGSLSPLIRGPWLRQGVMVFVMFFMAFPLPTSAIARTLRSPAGPVLATLVNYGLLPLLAWGLASVLWLSPDMRAGLMVAMTTPCTLASAAVWTHRAGGNDAIAIVVMVATNLVCFVCTPFWLSGMLGQLPDFNGQQMASQLVLLAVLPMLAAQLLRAAGPLGAWATHHKQSLSILVQVGVLLMVLMGSIQTGLRLAGTPVAALWLELAGVIAAVVVAHLMALFTGVAVARRIGLSREDAIAVGFAGSQKTLTVGLEVCAQLGTTVLPMVAYHVGQLLLDTLVADYFREAAGPADQPAD